MKLTELLKKENNNLDIFRLLAACMVVYGHAYAVAPQVGQTDFIARMLGYDYSGSLAVKIFFFLSGLVVTNSLLQKRNLKQFVIARFFRIWPGLIAVVVVTTLLITPFITELSISDYLTQKKTYSYIIHNLLLRTDYFLPGALLDNPYKGVINGSLWTLPLEVGAYLALVAFFMMGVFRSSLLIVGIGVFLLADPLTGNHLLMTWRPANMQVDLLFPCFALGAMLAFFKDRLEVGLGTAGGFILLYLLFESSAYSFLFLYSTLFSTIIYLSGHPVLLKLKPRADLSYGVYLWGFPVQQILQHVMPQQGTQFNQVASLLITLVFGFASWHLVEKRSIALGQKIIRKLA